VHDSRSYGVRYITQGQGTGRIVHCNNTGYNNYNNNNNNTSININTKGQIK